VETSVVFFKYLSDLLSEGQVSLLHWEEKFCILIVTE